MRKFPISNFKFQMPKGFTLVELLAATAVIMIVGGIITSILFSSLRGSSKTLVLTQVRQQGSFAISQMVKELRSAVTIVSFKVYHDFPVPDEVFDGTTYCNLSGTLREFDEVTFTTLDQETIALQCKQSPTDQIYSNSDKKTPSDTTDDSKVELLENSLVTMPKCKFTCLKDNPSAPPVIGISFDLTEKRYSGLAQINEKSTGPTPIPFKSSVALRN